MVNNMLMAGDYVRVVKGCASRGVAKNARLRVLATESLGADYGHSVRVVLGDRQGNRLGLVARHINRLSDAAVRLNDGNPLHVVIVQPIA